MIRSPWLLLALAPCFLAAPAPGHAPPLPIIQPTAASLARANPLRGPKPTAHAASAFDVELKRRGIGDGVKSFLDSVVSDVGSDVSSFVGSGVLNFPNGFPTGTAVIKSLGIHDSDLNPIPTQALNLPAYANWTNKGWNVRVHGNIYKIPNISQSKIDDLANVFLIDTSIKDLPQQGQAQARNVTREIFVVQQGGEQVTVDFKNDVEIPSNKNGGAINAKGGQQTINMPYNTTFEGDFDAFVQLKNTTGSNDGYLMPGNETDQVQALNMYTKGTNTGNATAYLVPDHGFTVISDIDDILRVTKIYDPEEGLLNTFGRPFTAWMNMPDIYANWSQSLPNLHFHYLTTTPEQATRNYMDFIYKTYPLGSFDTRPLNFSDLSATLSIRRALLDKIFQTFPNRKFVLVADTSNSDVMKDYPAMYKDYPGQVACIFLRNTSNTDSSDHFPYDTSGFKGIPQNNYMFFDVPNDLRNLDFVNSQCLNQTIKQHVTFSEQGLPFGLSKDDSKASGRLLPSLVFTTVLGLIASFITTL